MKATAALALIVLLPLAAQAQSRPSTVRMSCRGAAALVAQRGAVVLSTGSDRYDRYVSDQGYCPAGYYGRPAYVPTADSPQCFVGFYCSGTPPFMHD